MATAPTSRKLNLTRDQLAQFLTDQQQIRQFELLFSVVDELQVITGTDFEYQADTAAATANEALAQLSALAQDTAVDEAVLNAKVQQALDAVAQLARTLELIATAPAIQNNNSVVTDYIDFNTTTPSPAVKVGRMHWNGGYTLNLEMTPNVNQAIGESQYYYIKASAAIAKGQLIMFDGAVGASGVLKGKPSTGLTNGQLIMGVAAEAIANNGFGLVSSFGLVRGFNTTGTPYGEVWADGDILYYNPSFAGGLSKNIPAAPTPHVVVAAVVNAATAGSGSVFVRVQAEPLVSQLSDVYAPTPLAGDVLIYDATQQRWESNRLTAGTNVSITNADGSITINSTNPGGTVTSVTGTSPVVSSGGTTPAISLASGYGDTQNPYAAKTANYVLAAPNGSSGVPTFRALVAADIPALPYGTGTVTSVSVVSANGFAGTVANSTTTPAITMSTSISGLLYGNGTALASTTVSAPLAYSAGTLSITQSGTASNGYLSSTDWNTFNNKGNGTVTSVTASSPLASSGGTTPNITITGSALTKTDDTNVTMTLGGSPTTALLAAASMTLGWTGQLSVGRGGTGLSTLTTGRIPFGNGASAFGSSANLFWDNTNNRLGLGTSSPATWLHILTGASSSADIEAIRLVNNGENGTYINFNNAFGAVGRLTVTKFGGGSSADEGKMIFSLATNSTLNTGMTLDYAGNLAVVGALSKGSGSFKIEHPLESMKETHDLVHSFVEAPQADLYYRGKVQLVNGKASVNIDSAAGMTEGTFEVLCRDVQCFTSNETDWDAVRGSVSGNVLSIECQNQTSTATVSWLVIGERKDKHMYETDWTDDNGKVIVEPLKIIEEQTERKIQ